jgi:hypothetical protein
MARGLLLAWTLAFALAFADGGRAATTQCWERVLEDWSADSQVDHGYRLGCYRTAISKLPEDLRAYSSAPQDIQQAMNARLASAPEPTRVAASATPGNSHDGFVRALILFASLTVVAVLAAAALR